MPEFSLRPALDVPSCVLVASLLACAAETAHAQIVTPSVPSPHSSPAAAPAAPAKDAAPPEPAETTAEPAPTPPGPAGVPPVSGAPDASPQPGTPPATPGPGTPPAAPGTPPPPPAGEPPARYGRFGGEGEPPIQPGEWDPWLAPVRERFTHDGFFLRFNLGPGYTQVWRSNFRWTGLGVGMNLSVGGAVVRNLVLHADLRGVWLGNPRQRTHGHSSDFDADIVLESLGAGVTYYIMPYNVYLTGTVGVGVFAFEDNGGGASKDSKAGLTLSGALGKEWWVAADWGVGIAGQVVYMRAQDYVDDKHLHGLALNIVFSATYN